MDGGFEFSFSLSIKNRALKDEMAEIRIGPFTHKHLQFNLGSPIVSSRIKTSKDGAYLKIDNSLKPSEQVDIQIPAIVQGSLNLGEVSVSIDLEGKHAFILTNCTLAYIFAFEFLPLVATLCRYCFCVSGRAFHPLLSALVSLATQPISFGGDVSVKFRLGTSPNINTKKLQPANLRTIRPVVKVVLTSTSGAPSTAANNSTNSSLVDVAPGDRLDLRTTVSLAEGTCANAKLVLCYDKSVALTGSAFNVIEMDSAITNTSGSPEVTQSSKCPHGRTSGDNALVLALGDLRHGAANDLLPAAASAAILVNSTIWVANTEANVRGRRIRLVSIDKNRTEGICYDKEFSGPPPYP